MAKTSGGVRTLKTGSKEYSLRALDVERMRNSGIYSSVEFSHNGGGYVAIENSTMSHKAEELEAARILANNGYKVILGNEAGQLTTSEGQIFSFSYEQHTPEGRTYRNFAKSLAPFLIFLYSIECKSLYIFY